MKPAFTLIEIIVSVFIIITISSLLLVNYHFTNKRNDLLLTVHSLASDLRLAQEKSLGLIKYGNAYPTGGWGIYFNLTQPDRYLIFADLNNNKLYDVGESLEENGGQTIILKSGIVFDTLNGASDLAITFSNFPLKTNISNPGNSYAVAIINLKENVGASIKGLSINSLGLVEINQ